jgi:hypothetical protein
MTGELKQFINRSFSLKNCHDRNGAAGNDKEKEKRMIGSDFVRLCAVWMNATRKRKLRSVTI